MGAKTTTPYRNDRDHLQDWLHLIELRQKVYTLKTRSREWLDEGFFDAFERDEEAEAVRRAEIRRLDARIRALSQRIETKTALAQANGHPLNSERIAAKYGLTPLEMEILLVLLLDDITVSGGKTYARGKDILGLLLDDRMSVLDSRRHLYPVSALLSSGLVICSSPDESTVLDAYFKISERAVRELTEGIGGRDLAGQLDLAFDDAALVGDADLKTPQYRLEDVVLPERCRLEVEHLLGLTRHADLLLNTWGFGESHRREGMTTAIFSGPPGTGKTMTAQAVAHALEKKILIVSYPEMVSKWVGETEKNISRVFARAAKHDAVLLFDEADAMFHTRVAVSNATDQSFNREVNVLLQEVERFPGVLVLTTNRPDDLDQAFERRIGVRIQFPMPDPVSRERIWRKHVPSSAPLAADVNLQRLAARFPFAGGHIKNAILRAAAAAATRNQGASARITMADFSLAAEREMATCSTAAAGRRIGFSEARQAS